jgi:flavin reductase (DIM6/NTAB) family NADH-FMN oxidoreductase RutF
MKKSLGPRTIPFPAPVWVVGSYDAAGRPNMMTASWVGICCSRPPCIAVSLRQQRYSYANLVARGAFTISVPSREHVKVVDYWGIVSGRDEDKLARSGLTAARSELVDAPYVAAFPAVMECRVLHTLELGSHTQFVGEILDVKVDEALLGSNGQPDFDRLALFVYADEYRAVGGIVAEAFTIGKEV